MPRMKTIKPALQEQIEKELRAKCDLDERRMTMTAREVGKAIGLKDTAAAKWLTDVAYSVFNGRKRYFVSAVAEKIYLNMNA